MSEEPVQETRRTATDRCLRCMVVLAAVVSLVLSQAIVSLTHSLSDLDGPAVVSHDGHAHGEEGGSDVWSHDAGDHEHQVTDLAAHSPRDAVPASRYFTSIGNFDFEGVIGDGRRRPPALV